MIWCDGILWSIGSTSIWQGLSHVLSCLRDVLIGHGSLEKRRVVKEHAVNLSFLSNNLTELSLDFSIFSFTQINDLTDFGSEIVQFGKPTVTGIGISWSIVFGDKNCT